MRGGEILTLSTLTHSGAARPLKAAIQDVFNMPLCAIYLKTHKIALEGLSKPKL